MMEEKNICENKKKYLSTQYTKKYYDMHKNDVDWNTECSICGGRYNKFNKSRHNKTKKHILSINKTFIALEKTA